MKMGKYVDTSFEGLSQMQTKMAEKSTWASVLLVIHVRFSHQASLLQSNHKVSWTKSAGLKCKEINLLDQ